MEQAEAQTWIEREMFSESHVVFNVERQLVSRRTFGYVIAQCGVGHHLIVLDQLAAMLHLRHVGVADIFRPEFYKMLTDRHIFKISPGSDVEDAGIVPVVHLVSRLVIRIFLPIVGAGKGCHPVPVHECGCVEEDIAVENVVPAKQANRIAPAEIDFLPVVSQPCIWLIVRTIITLAILFCLCIFEIVPAHIEACGNAVGVGESMRQFGIDVVECIVGRAADRLDQRIQ